MKTRITALVIIICIFLTILCGCANDNTNTEEVTEKTATKDTAGEVTTGEIGVIQAEEYGGILFDLSIDEFNALGFDFGDSVNVRFDNGATLDDIPYYTGYYVPIDELLICGYPGSPHPKIARNYGDSTWDEFQMTKDSKVTVTLNEKAKYLSTQELNDLEYSDKREDYESDIVFSNFREVSGGALREKGFYRSASPCDNQHNRAQYANALAEENGIKFAINLSDNETEYLSYPEADDFVSVYYDDLYRDGNVLLLDLNANYRADGFAKSVSESFLKMTESDGPCLIHCVEGKDRTGFVCVLLLALAEASSDEIIDDYMETYKNYYGITKESQPDTYDAILVNVYDFLYCICEADKDVAIDTLDLKAGGENYLRKGGLTDDQINKIEAYIR